MPNYVYNRIKIYGEKVELNNFKESVAGRDETVISFNSIIPPPDDPSEWSEDGFPGWYTWWIRHWGTKWDCWDLDLSINKDHLFYKFITAYSPPFPIFDKLIETHPQLKFDIVSYETVNDWAYELEAKNSEYTKIIEEEMKPLQVGSLKWGNCGVDKMLCSRKDLLNNRINISIEDIFWESFPKDEMPAPAEASATTDDDKDKSENLNSAETKSLPATASEDMDDDDLLAELDKL